MSRTGTRYLLSNYRINQKIPKWELISTANWFQPGYIAGFKSSHYTLTLNQKFVILTLDLPTCNITYMSKQSECWIQTHYYKSGKEIDRSIQDVYDVKCYNDWYKYIQV